MDRDEAVITALIAATGGYGDTLEWRRFTDRFLVEAQESGLVDDQVDLDYVRNRLRSHDVEAGVSTW